MNINRWLNFLNPRSNRLASRTILTAPAWGTETPWSGSNNLGNIVYYNPDVNNRQSILKLDEWGPPEMWTVSLFREHRPPLSGTDYWITAEISFGAGGSTQTIEVDWLTGTMLSVPMNAISVTAKFSSFNLAGFPIAPADKLRLGAQIARGVRGGSRAPTLSKRLGIIAPGTTGVPVEIPAFTRTVEITSSQSDYTGDPAFTANFSLYFGMDTGVPPYLDYRKYPGTVLPFREIPIDIGYYSMWGAMAIAGNNCNPVAKFYLGA